MVKRINRACKYFPCHKGLEDCTFCYCPFYPCLNNELGEYIFAKKRGPGIWSCKDCSWIHKKRVVDRIFNLLRRGGPRPFPGLGRMTGIIILAHGSKVKKTNVTMHRLIKELKRKTGSGAIEASYLQLCGPDFHTIVKRIVKKGYKRILVIPFFLFAGNHVGKDIPKEIEREAKLFKEVEFIYAKSIGSHPGICDIVSDCIKEAL